MDIHNPQYITNEQIEKLTPEEIQKQIKESSQRSCSSKLYVYNWLRDIKNVPATHNLIEVRFKNTRKDYYENNTHIPLENGDIVAVESSPGHDIGIVSLTGELVLEQIKKNKIKKPDGFPKVYRKAKPSDIEKWEEAKALEHKTMIKSRQISKDLRLNMKIGDVEYQGDKTKAIFYYIADERVDFRELIKVLAETFKIRVEMRQIGARQEAGRIGGIGPCGRDLCCSTFINSFVSVSTNAARFQEISLNPQKLAGQCSKLKCCLNYELPSYMDARKNFPDTNIPLEFIDCRAHHAKTDVFRQTMWYVYRKDEIPHFLELQVSDILDIIAQNKKGIKPEKPIQVTAQAPVKDKSGAIIEVHDYSNVVGQESLTRFDSAKKKNKQKNKPGGPQNPNNGPRPQNQNNGPKPQNNNNGPKPGNPQQNAFKGPNHGNKPENKNPHINADKINKPVNPVQNQHHQKKPFQKNKPGNNPNNNQNNAPKPE